MTRDEMLVLLRSGVCNVTFTKVNGESRDMRCTLVRDMIPEEKIPKSPVDTEAEEPTKVNEAVIRVFDLVKTDWRSFKVDSVTEFKAE